ncbi:origin recognition complex subunit 3-like [Aphis craccivora]|uniref:Origin recognition complex subunit 3-like n=1 Tax=Aphis craccivora TaxID=307492 RepID=A0A6G0ZCN3_APHCR|nr:origin recognition complex subunit 3-like [Aphis craccivora]
MAFDDSASVVVKGNPISVMNRYTCKMRNKRMWKSLRAHILSRREKDKQAEIDAELLRKKKHEEELRIQENKLSLAQINGRLSELRGKRDELEEEKRELLNQKQTILNTVLAVPEPKCANYDRKLVTKIKFKSSIIPNIDFLDNQQQQQQQQPQHLLSLLETKPCMDYPIPLFKKKFHEKFTPISQPAVIPTDVKESNKSNCLSLQQPN